MRLGANLIRISSLCVSIKTNGLVKAILQFTVPHPHPQLLLSKSLRRSEAVFATKEVYLAEDSQQANILCCKKIDVVLVFEANL